MTVCFSLQNCPKEISKKGIQVTWHESTSGSDIESDPLCYFDNNLVTRQCNNTEWSPSLTDLDACLKIVQHFNLSSCPPGFIKISENSNKHCYQINKPSEWNYPCLKNGGASILNDLSENEAESLINSLVKLNESKYFWLPAHRAKPFSPVIWTIPGPNWGRIVDRDFNKLRSSVSWFKNCLLLDVEQLLVKTETCDKSYPSLCLYVNNLNYPAECPEGYYGFRFMPDDDRCFGIEQALDMTLTYNEFLNTSCKDPMGGSGSEYNEITRFVFKKVAEMKSLPDDAWCWFEMSYDTSDYLFQDNSKITPQRTKNPLLQGIINNNGTLGLTDTQNKLSCMACETPMAYKDTVLTLEYIEQEFKLYLTIYFPSGLWKYDFDDRGVQCFSDANGFVKVVDVNIMPFLETANVVIYDLANGTNVEKVVYIIDLVTKRSAQYWCEGHTKQLSLIATNKVVVNPEGNQLHVFALFVKTFVFDREVDETMGITNLTDIVATTLNAEQVLVMEVFEYSMKQMIMLLHVHVALAGDNEDKGNDIKATLNILKDKAENELQNFNITFLNISSSLYCLPTTTIDYTLLEWELTPIDHIAAPKQFCLQHNGLPVKRQCRGSYAFGGYWGNVDGQCDTKFEPSATTTFLYNFIRGRVSQNTTLRFLIDGLNFVLGGVDILIPADIYYLAKSLQHILNIVQQNETSVEMGDIENMAWAMDRILILDNTYLRLSQLFNSTNIIVDSVSEIIERIAQKRIVERPSNFNQIYYHLAVEPQFLVQVSYPEFTNITGIAISRKTKSNKFSDMLIQPLFKNTTLEYIFSIKNIELATWVPDNVLNSLIKTSNTTSNDSYNDSVNSKDVHVIINVFHNDAVFQQLDESVFSINSRVIGISIPGYISNLKFPVALVFKEINPSPTEKVCGYWDFEKKIVGGSPGFWTNHGCFYLNTINDMTICECYHMTHFGQLIDIGGNPNIRRNEVHSKTLNIITLIGSFLSLLGIAGIWITACVFQTWRKKPGTKVLLQLSTAIALPLIFIVVFDLDNTIFINIDGHITISDNMKVVCIALGAFLHYSILASFMWMLITAILQFVRYVRVFGVHRPSRFMIKFTLIGWGVPLFPVMLVLLLDSDNYIPDLTSVSSTHKICYPTGIYFTVSVLVPICIILLINIILFLLVIHAISIGPDGKMRTTDTDLVGAQLRVSIFLFFLLGLTWIFGIFSFSDTLFWSYLFCLTSTLQGFVLFIYFVICDPVTRTLWVTLMRPQFRMSSSRESIVSISSN